jgi:2'-5' RNA ligase
MRLFAALVPPRPVLEAVTQLAAGVRPEREPAAEQDEPGRHAASAGRLFGRRRGRVTTSARSNEPMLDLLDPIRMHVLIAKLGANLTLTDAARLTNAMEEQASGWESPRLHLKGGVALEPEGDDSVWVGLRGDVDELFAISRGVARVAQGLHLFVDRRAFRPEIRLGTINGATTEAYLEQLLAALGAYESPAWWQTSISLLIPADLGPSQPPYKVHREIPLGPAVSH